MRTLEEKKILVNAICEYMPYEPCIANEDIDSGFPIRIHVGDLRLGKYLDGYTLDSEKYGGFKSDKTVIYLRPMDSMTEEEKKEYGKVCELDTEILANHPMNGEPFPALYNSQDWLNAHLFDYRGLIEKGIAKPVGTEKRWVSTETLKKTTEIIENTIKETKKITEDGQKKNRRVKR